MAEVAAANAEALEAWNGVLFDRFVAFRSLIIEGIAPHGDAAIRLYEGLGFERHGVRRGYYTDNREDALIMWRDAPPS